VSAIARARNEGDRDAAAYAAGAPPPPQSEFWKFSDGCRFRALVIRRALAALRVPPRLVALLRPLCDSRRLAAFEKFLLQYAYWRGVQRRLDRETWRQVQRGPVILMYHAVATRRSEPASCYVVPRRRFTVQMAWLNRRGYRVISLGDLIAHLRTHRLPPARSVVITFDDGYEDNCETALPILQRYGFPATVFVVSGAIGSTAQWTTEPALMGRPVATGAQLAAMVKGGIEIGAHTQTHPSLTAIPPLAQEAELRGSREDLERLLGKPVRSFAYPFGDYAPDIARRVAEAGFDAACSSRSGVNDPATPLFQLRRVEVRGTYSLWSFAWLLWRAHRPRRAKRTRQVEQAA